MPASETLLPPIATAQPAATGAWRRHARWLLISIVIAGVGVAVRLTYLRPAAVPVTVMTVETGRVEELIANNRAGTITARRQAALAPETGGRVVRLPAREGAVVRRGDVLLVLSDTEFKAQAELHQRSLDAARAMAVEACAAASLAALELDRTRRLERAGAVSAQAVDQAGTRQITAEAGCTAATARVSETVAGLDAARAVLAKTVLRAPFGGTISRVSTEVGEWVTPSPAGLQLPAVIELIDTHSIYVRAPLDEVDANRVRAGLPVRIQMDAYPGHSFPGRVTRIGAYVSEALQQNRTFDIEVAFDDPAVASTLLPGTSADVEVILDARDNVTRVPTSALLQGGRLLVVRQDTLVAVPVRTGIANWEHTEVLSGVIPGDRVVVSLDRLEVKEGARVTIEAAGPR